MVWRMDNVEIRSTKYETNSKHKYQRTPRSRNFSFWILNLFRISIFRAGLRVVFMGLGTCLRPRRVELLENGEGGSDVVGACRLVHAQACAAVARRVAGQLDPFRHRVLFLILHAAILQLLDHHVRRDDRGGIGGLHSLRAVWRVLPGACRLDVRDLLYPRIRVRGRDSGLGRRLRNLCIVRQLPRRPSAPRRILIGDERAVARVSWANWCRQRWPCSSRTFPSGWPARRPSSMFASAVEQEEWDWRREAEKPTGGPTPNKGSLFLLGIARRGRVCMHPDNAASRRQREYAPFQQRFNALRPVRPPSLSWSGHVHSFVSLVMRVFSNKKAST